MKKWFAILLTMCLLACSAALAEETALPGGVNFYMNANEVAKALGPAAEISYWEEEGAEGTVYAETFDGFDGLNVTSASFDVTANNSDKAPRLAQINLTLDVGDDCIQAFRDALLAMTAAYGEPDSDPFDESCVQTYVEYGTLGAYWTKADVRIALDMYRMYNESLTVSFTNRLCYDAEDLKTK